MTPHGNDGSSDPGIREVLEELRYLRLEANAERLEARAERQQADSERHRTEAAAEVDRRQAEADRRRSDERFEQVMRESRESFQQAFRDVRTVGLSIVKTLNRHTRLLERIDRKLGVGGNGSGGNGRSA